jgi:hypothetical protein
MNGRQFRFEWDEGKDAGKRTEMRHYTKGEAYE